MLAGEENSGGTLLSRRKTITRRNIYMSKAIKYLKKKKRKRSMKEDPSIACHLSASFPRFRAFLLYLLLYGFSFFLSSL